VAQRFRTWYAKAAAWLRSGGGVAALPALAAAAVSAPLFAHPLCLAGQDTWRSHDWLASAKFDAFARIALLRWQALPHWNPFLQGGMPQLAHPSDGSLSPLFLPSLLFGEALGMKLVVLLCLIAGACGTALLARDRWSLPSPYATFAGGVWGVGGGVPSRVSVGFYESTLLPLFPLIAWLLFTSDRRPRRLLLAALLLATGTMQVQLGLPMLMLALVLLVVLDVATRASTWTLALRLAAVCAGAMGVAAIKLVPMAHFLAAADMRRMAAYPEDHSAWYGSAGELLRCLLSVVPYPGQYDERGFVTLGEYGYAGLGLPAVVLLGIALVTTWRAPRALWIPAGLFVLFVWLSFGPNAPLDLFRLLWPLPLFESMRGPLRYSSFVVFWLACPLAAAGLQSLRRGRWAIPAWCAGLIGAAALLVPALQSAPRFGTSFTEKVALSPPPTEAFVQEKLAGEHMGQSRGGHPRFDHGNLLKYANLKAGIGTIYDPEDIPDRPTNQGWRRYHVDESLYRPNPSYRGEAWCAGHDCAAQVPRVQANRLRVQASLDRADMLVLNQRWNPAWRTTAGAAQEVDGLVGVWITDPGELTVEYRYRSPGFTMGAIVSLCTLLLGFGLALRGYATRRSRTAR